MTYVTIKHDPDPDFSWLEQDHYNPEHPSYDPCYRTKEDADMRRNPIDGDWYRDPENHVALCMIAYDDNDQVTDSLGNIDFLFDMDDWKTGQFTHLRQLVGFPYLAELAKEMGLLE